MINKHINTTWTNKAELQADTHIGSTDPSCFSLNFIFIIENLLKIYKNQIQNDL